MPVAPEATTAPVETVPVTISVAPVAVEEPVAATAPPISLEEGKAVYDKSCFACHKTGVAGSPIVGDKDVWAPRIATGKEALYAVALTGKGAMPPKGGNMALGDDKVKAAVDYMVEQSK